MIFVTTYFLSIVYNTVKLKRIRKETIQKCKEKLEGAGCVVNPKNIKFILEYTSAETIDDLGYRMLSYMPFGNFWISYKLASGKIENEYRKFSDNILSYRMQGRLEKAGIIPRPTYIKALTKEERMEFEKTHQIYRPGYSLFVSDMERLIDGLPSNEELSMEEVNQEFDRTIEESKNKVLKKKMK